MLLETLKVFYHVISKFSREVTLKLLLRWCLILAIFQAGGAHKGGGYGKLCKIMTQAVAKFLPNLQNISFLFSFISKINVRYWFQKLVSYKQISSIWLTLALFDNVLGFQYFLLVTVLLCFLDMNKLGTREVQELSMYLSSNGDNT